MKKKKKTELSSFAAVCRCPEVVESVGGVHCVYLEIKGKVDKPPSEKKKKRRNNNNNSKLASTPESS